MNLAGVLFACRNGHLIRGFDIPWDTNVVGKVRGSTCGKRYLGCFCEARLDRIATPEQEAAWRLGAEQHGFGDQP